MTNPARTERLTQQRVVRLFTDPNHPHSLGYDYLGDWQKREANSGIEVSNLKRNLEQRGYSSAQVSAALQELQKAADVTRDSLYQANRRVYQLLRYGIKVKVAIEKEHEDVYLINWENVEANHFALAEEVTLRHGSERRPDIVLYINGLAIAVMELKRGSLNVNDAIQQLRTNQEEQFNAAFFSTVQYLFAGSDAQGLRYGTTGADTKYFLSWKQGGDAQPSEGYLLDLPLMQMCQKDRLLDLIRNCIIFDAGIKKVPREHQYHGVSILQEHYPSWREARAELNDLPLSADAW